MSIRIAIALALACTAALGAQRDFDLRNTSTLTRTLRFSGAGPQTLEVRLIHGSIRVTAHDGDDVRIEARKTVMANTDSALDLGNREAVIDTLETGSTLGLVVQQLGGSACRSWNGDGRQRRPSYHVIIDVTVQVPRRTDLALCTINDGEIHVDGTEGEFDLSNVNGRIKMTGIGGAGSAETVNGGVDVSFLAQPTAASLFKTLNGNVIVRVPGELSADLRMKTFNGGLFTDFDVQPLAQRATATRQGGRYIYRANEFVAMRAGSGGPELTFESFNGDVRLLRASR